MRERLPNTSVPRGPGVFFFSQHEIMNTRKEFERRPRTGDLGVCGRSCVPETLRRLRPAWCLALSCLSKRDRTIYPTMVSEMRGCDALFMSLRLDSPGPG
jgi:hypothetical protein